MSTDLTEVPLPPDPVAAHLKECGIEQVLLIDDAFDPFDPTALQDEIAELWDKILRSEELKAELSTLNIVVRDASDIDENILDTLFEMRESLPTLGPICEASVFAERLSKLSDLAPLKSHFKQLGIATVDCGSDEALPDQQFKLIFLDYSLGPDESVGAVTNARQRAEDIYQAIPEDANKPFIVLMSSKPNADLAQNDFRDKSRLLGGLFAFLKKGDFRNREKLNLYLATWALGMPTRHSIQRFVEALDRSANAACQEFSRRVRALGAEDYANIQHLSLRPDGHPLGDYMLWLYKSLFSHLLHDHPDVLREQKQLDALTFQHFTPSQSAPSMSLAEIYRCALTEPGVGALGPHPQAPAGNTEPYLQLGDMFFKTDGGRDVLIALSAACDLAYAPGSPRSFPKNQFVLFEYGELQPIADDPRETAMRTDLFYFNPGVFRILWDHRRAVWKEYGIVEEWLRTEGFVRQTRLSLPYALELQKSFADYITRIGMPVKPPILLKADVEVVGEGTVGNCTVLAGIPAGAQVIRRRQETKDGDEELFVLTVDCVGQVLASLQQVVDRIRDDEQKLEQEIGTLKKSGDGDAPKKLGILLGQQKGLTGESNKITKLMQVYERWLPMVRQLQKLPSSGGKSEIDPKLLWVYRNAKALLTGKYPSGPPIVLHIITTYEAREITRTDQDIPVAPQEAAHE